MSTQPKSFLTPEEYLAIEREAETKSEYWNGEMFPMSGARRPGDRDGASAHSRETIPPGMSTQPEPFLTAEEYLAIEREAEPKSEYSGWPDVRDVRNAAAAQPDHCEYDCGIGHSACLAPL
jgi:hypothetical protein